MAMVTLSEIHEQAMQLPSAQRASLAADLLGSLDPVMLDDDEGVEEALRRDAEMDENPSLEMTLYSPTSEMCSNTIRKREELRFLSASLRCS